MNLSIAASIVSIADADAMPHCGKCPSTYIRANPYASPRATSALLDGANGMKLTIANNVQRGYKEVDAVQIVGE